MRASRNNARSPREALKRFHAFLREHHLRTTEVRDAIVEAAVRRQGHFRVEDLAAEARASGLDVSVATVYRAIPLLVEAGIIQATEVSGDRGHYETVFGRSHHDHLICRACGKVVEFQFEAFEILQRELAAKYGFELVDHFHELIGICSTCRGREVRYAH